LHIPEAMAGLGAGYAFKRGLGAMGRPPNSRQSTQRARRSRPGDRRLPCFARRRLRDALRQAIYGRRAKGN
jgi:hypothetical protein